MADQSANSAHVSHDDLRVMMDAINKKLAREKSPISSRERKYLDRIARAKVCLDGGYNLRHPKCVQLVEFHGGDLHMGTQQIDAVSLIDLSLKSRFEIRSFELTDLQDTIDDFRRFHEIITAQDEGPASANSEIPERVPLAQDIPLRIVAELEATYSRVFKLPPYLGGVGPSANVTIPSSPFGIFAQSVLQLLGIRTRTGSTYSLNTIKNLMSGGGYGLRKPDDEPLLIEARERLIPRRKRGRPSKRREDQ
jgi:hypothetical protein